MVSQLIDANELYKEAQQRTLDRLKEHRDKLNRAIASIEEELAHPFPPIKINHSKPES